MECLMVLAIALLGVIAFMYATIARQNIKLNLLKQQNQNLKSINESTLSQYHALEKKMEENIELKKHGYQWVAENIVILTSSNDVKKTRLSLDGLYIDRLNLKISIGRYEKNMINDLKELLDTASDCLA